MIRLTREQLREIDRRCVADYGLPSIVLMENAASGAARCAREMLGAAHSAEILILCGGGNNGGDGFAIARHLHNAGYRIQIALTVDPVGYKGDALINYNVVRAMRLPMERATAKQIGARKVELIIDAIFGTGLSAPPRAPFDEIVAAVSATRAPVMAVDIPSGLDCDTGHPLGPTIRATRTVSFVAEKIGFANPAAGEYLGDVEVVPIGAPSKLLVQVMQSPI